MSNKERGSPTLDRGGGEASVSSRKKRDSAARSTPAKIYIYHVDHENDRVFTENVVEYLVSQNILWRSIPLNRGGYRPELELCLDDRATAVLGYNTQLDHSWLDSGSFLEAAEQQGVPVIQWILDHPSSRWNDFQNSNTTNSRFLLNSEQARQYFEAYCLPGALTAATGGVGPNQRSRISTLTRRSFIERLPACIIPLNLHRICGIEQNEQKLAGLERPLADAVRAAIASAQYDLTGALHRDLQAVLTAGNQTVPPRTFNALCQIVEQSVQTIRRLKIFAVARKYPVLIQSDDSAAAFVKDSTAIFASNIGMQFTLAALPLCRAVLSVNTFNDMIHDRTMNALNGGCVAITEDNLAGKGLFKHKVNALLFRYDDDSLDECLDIVCNQPDRAYEIAQAGLRLRDDPRLRFGQFHNILALAEQRLKFGDAIRA
jgi:hypothetical protein